MLIMRTITPCSGVCAGGPIEGNCGRSQVNLILLYHRSPTFYFIQHSSATFYFVRFLFEFYDLCEKKLFRNIRFHQTLLLFVFYDLRWSKYGEKIQVSPHTHTSSIYHSSSKMFCFIRH